MAVPISGNFGRLEDLIQRVKAMSLPNSDFRRGLLANVAEAARTEIVLGFERGRDPYGVKWAPLKAKSGRRVGGQPLRDRGQMQNSFSVRPTSSGFDISAVIYAKYHQDGTSRMVARRMMPTGNDLGPIWRRAFESVFESAINREMRRR